MMDASPPLIPRIPELLAPAGDSIALHAAVTAGADAVYLGFGEFNARRNAANFDEETLREGCDYAHLRDVSVYATMNTIVLPGQMEEALRCASRAYGCGADAFIVQDVGLALRLQQELPVVPLHISTQMNIHNADGIRACAELGAQRVTLARELSLREIADLSDIAAELGMQVEVFAHGALCVCYSGQCLMSSMIGGRSANRGLCAQPCRLPYRLTDARKEGDAAGSPTEHLLSPKDLCSIDVLPELVETGVSSLKIEGRMKSPEYVMSVVSVYRSVLDRLAVSMAPTVSFVTEEERTRLGSVFSRGFTTAYLTGDRGNEIMSYKRPNNRGQFAGRIKSVERDGIVLSADMEFSSGDLLEVWTKKRNIRIPVEHMERTGKKTVRIDVEDTKGLHANDRVFRIRSAEAAFHDDPLAPRIAVDGSVKIEEGKPLKAIFWLSSREEGEPLAASAEGPVVEPARTKPLSEADVREHIDRLGSTPFILDDLEVLLDEGVGLGFSQLHHVRAEALAALEERMLEAYRGRTLQDAHEPAKGRVRRMPCGIDPRDAVIAVRATNPECARAAKRAGATDIYVPALNFKRGQAEVQGRLKGEVSQAGFPKHTIPMIPVISHDPVGDAREARISGDVWEYAEAGEPVFVESLGAMQHALEMGASIEVGPHLPIANEYAAQVADAFGARRIWLTPELNLSQIGSLAEGCDIPLGLTVFGAQELMVMEHCLLMSQGPCNQDCPSCPRRKAPHRLNDRKDYGFPVTTDMFGRSHLYNSVPFDGVPFLRELLDAGVSAFMVDATLLDPEETAQAVGRLAKALEMVAEGKGSMTKQPDTTSGHLHRGVQ